MTVPPKSAVQYQPVFALCARPTPMTLNFAFTSLAVLNTLTTIALQRRRELALLRLAGATRGQIAAMTRWEAAVIVVTGVGLGVAISLATLLPFSRALDTHPYVPPGQAALIIAATAALAVVGLQLPTRIVSRSRTTG